MSRMAMAKELWVKCDRCDDFFLIVPDPQHSIKIAEIIDGESTGIIALFCPKQHPVAVDSSDNSRVSIRGR
jgi:hypothetical protein